MLKEVNPSVDAPVDQAEAGARMAAEGTDAGEAALIGAGRKVSKIGAGVKQAFLGLPSYPMTEDMNRRESERLAAQEDERDVAYGALRKKHPVATAAGEAAPYVAVPASAGIGTQVTSPGSFSSPTVWRGLRAAEPGRGKRGPAGQDGDGARASDRPEAGRRPLLP